MVLSNLHCIILIPYFSKKENNDWIPKLEDSACYKKKAHAKKLTPLILPFNQDDTPIRFNEGSVEIHLNNCEAYSITNFDNDDNFTSKLNNLQINKDDVNNPNISYNNYITQDHNIKNSNEINQKKMHIKSKSRDCSNLKCNNNIQNCNAKIIQIARIIPNDFKIKDINFLNQRKVYSNTVIPYSGNTSLSRSRPQSPRNKNKPLTYIEEAKLMTNQNCLAYNDSNKNTKISKTLSQTYTIKKNTSQRASEWNDQDCKDLLEGTVNQKGILDLKPSNLQKVSSLGHGSQGHVEKVLHIPTGTLIGLKSINLNTDESFLKALKLELDTLRGCNSDYIVKCYGAFYKQNQIAIALEFMDMGSLSDIVKAIGSIPEIILGYISYQVLKGLEYLHKTMKVIHRDIKPSNLLINSKGQVKIADFGVSGKIEYTLQYKRTWVGTVTYMSPERFQGSDYLFDTDLWSLGLSIIECALGKYPYPHLENVNYFDLMDYIITKPSPTLPEDFSSDFKDFVSICLRKEAGTRTSASELLKHPFVKNYALIDTNIFIQWLKNVYE